MRLISSLLVLTVMVAYVSAQQCWPNYCNNAKCGSPTLDEAVCKLREKEIPGSKWVLQEKGGPCQCCHACKRVLQEGEKCDTDRMNEIGCDKGLKCDYDKTKKCIKEEF